MRDQVHVCPDAEQLAQHVCDWLVAQIQLKQKESQEPYYLSLSGGSTPKRLYQLLSKLPAGTIDWARIVLVWGDERNVPIDDAESNFRMVRENLLEHVPIPEENVLGVPNPGGDAAEAAQAYEALLRERLPHGESGQPQLDCVLLGMGDDVHTASLFPGTKALEETQRWCIENWVDKFDCWRITLTAPALNAAHHVAFLIGGSSKQSALELLWHAPRDPQAYPSHLIRPKPGQLWFLLDQAALGSNEIPETSNVELIAGS